ncbi:hypothetical protein B0H17DRAFT_1050377 [Mycena rosella]|uniref:Uncharacterized protein n=1 Tax=Mycena rosella TaxID=1033263 RepID=A0AAD7DSH0_MYCRO|nr:hypothetical protein B0H17DRAFT_1050377 [Mycena rosella]
MIHIRIGIARDPIEESKTKEKRGADRQPTRHHGQKRETPRKDKKREKRHATTRSILVLVLAAALRRRLTLLRRLRLLCGRLRALGRGFLALLARLLLVIVIARLVLVLVLLLLRCALRLLLHRLLRGRFLLGLLLLLLAVVGAGLDALHLLGEVLAFVVRVRLRAW